MINSGIADQSILHLLLTEYAEHYDQLVRLMTKFGLLVQLRSAEVPSSDMSTSSKLAEYLVPALLPFSEQKRIAWSNQPYSTCYFVFTTSEKFEHFSTISEEELYLYGFLPQGLFERLLGKAVTWVRNHYMCHIWLFYCYHFLYSKGAAH